MAYDIVIRGGQIVDGTGKEPVHGDLGIENGIITAVGKVDGRGREELDAEGLTVSPGFVLICRGNGTPHLTLRSSPTHSRYSSAPWSRQTVPALAVKPL